MDNSFFQEGGVADDTEMMSESAVRKHTSRLTRHLLVCNRVRRKHCVNLRRNLFLPYYLVVLTELKK